MACDSCTDLKTIPHCPQTLIFDTPYNVAQITIVIENKHGTKYEIEGMTSYDGELIEELYSVDADGNIIFNTDIFPKNLFNQYSGVFKVQIINFDGNTLPIGNNDCGTFEVVEVQPFQLDRTVTIEL